MSAAIPPRAVERKRFEDQRLVLADIEISPTESLRLTCLAGPNQTPVLTAYVWRKAAGGEWYPTPIGIPLSFDIVDTLSAELLSARAEGVRRGLVPAAVGAA